MLVTKLYSAIFMVPFQVEPVRVRSTVLKLIQAPITLLVFPGQSRYFRPILRMMRKRFKIAKVANNHYLIWVEVSE